MDIKGHTVERVWVERASDIDEEYYASFTLDRAAKQHLLMLSAQGGVDIEEVAATDPDAIVKLHIDPVDGLSPETARQAAVDAKIPERAVDGVAGILVQLYECFTKGDCDLAEINPLILKPDGEVHALDAKVSLDDNAAFRHPEWEEWGKTEVLDDREQLAKEKGLQYIGLDGSVGIIANGAGLAMSTLDVVNQVGGKAANFLDIGGGANADVMAAALDVINHDENVRSIFVNIFGGITRGEEVAKGIVEGLGRVELRAPIVIRLDGTNAEEGRQIILDAGIPASQADQQADDARGRPRGRAHRQRLGRRSVNMSADASERAPASERPATACVAGERSDMAIFVDAGHQGPRPGAHRRAGQVPRPAQPGLRHADRRRRDARQGWPGRRGDPRLRHRRRGGRRHRGDGVVRRRAAEGGAGGDPRGRPPPASRFVVCITEGIPAQDEALVYNTLRRDFPGTRLLGPNCPGHHRPGQVQHRHHAERHRRAADGRRSQRRHRQPLRHADLPGAVRAQAERHRRVDVRRHRRRPGARHELRRLPRRVRGRPRDPRHDHVRRDRRLGRGGGGRVHRRPTSPSR